MSEKRIGIIGGSGLYHLEGLKELGWECVETAFGAPSDELLLGRYQEREVVFLPRHGRGHRILPSELNHRANIMAMKQLGVRWIISASAVGSLQDQYAPCDIVVIDQFLDRSKRSADHTLFGRGIVAHIAFADPLCSELRSAILEAAERLGARAHDGGTYVNMEGPAFSTRAESLQNHRDGHAVIGMTNLAEAKCAREAEIAYATMAMVTDYDGWKPHDPYVTVEVVIEYLQRNSETAKKMIGDVIANLDMDQECSCHSALENAILTDRDDWPAETIGALRPVVGRYLDKV
ncbi:MAG: S-methyl-5'-thioadenosine phosphorylase [Verrucomicrobia subdivision 3 bacterium]|nr:S-methyl-5'-thioadenosine phosphorylase [Limisphaerales bacterium]MCS1416436.1 S-methyl-5'-thioadenosine phosphorylase [Limisphaerales bacterium]